MAGGALVNPKPASDVLVDYSQLLARRQAKANNEVVEEARLSVVFKNNPFDASRIVINTSQARNDNVRTSKRNQVFAFLGGVLSVSILSFFVFRPLLPIAFIASSIFGSIALSLYNGK